MKKLFSFFIILAILLAVIYFVLFYKTNTTSKTPAKKSTNISKARKETNWYDDLIFQDENFSFEFARTIGYTYSQGADIGECIATGRSIKNADIIDWYDKWKTLADRIYDLANTWEKQGFIISATEAYLRASNYYRETGFFMRSKDLLKKDFITSGLSVQSFKKAIQSMPEISSISIPYENTYLPGYLIKSPLKNAPLIIINTGYDGTKEELYFEVAFAAQNRCYNCIFYDGPGQGEVIRDQDLYFRYDWEKVESAVIDYAETLNYIDKNKIAIIGISFGGYLAPRAAAFDDRIKALVANPGILDFYDGITTDFPQDFLNLSSSDPQSFDNEITQAMKEDVTTKWFFENGLWTFGISSPAEFIQALKKYSLKCVAQNIKCPTLVINNEKDSFLVGQPKQLYDALTCPKTYLEFTVEDTAQAHCEMGAIAISTEKIFNWLDETLGYKNGN
jgi:pimeloyl-ACP methyl ester carboxylesterase